jgi:hypothetical protein
MKLNLLENLKPHQIVRFSNVVTTDTVTVIIKLIKDSRYVPEVRYSIEDLFTNIPEKDYMSEIKRLYEYVRDNMRYTRDISNIEYVKTPYRHIKDIEERGLTFGDCDDHTVLLGALLFNAGYTIRIVITKNTPNATGFHHIYLHVNIPMTSGWICLDATIKNKDMGYEASYLEREIYEVS